MVSRCWLHSRQLHKSWLMTAQIYRMFSDVQGATSGSLTSALGAGAVCSVPACTKHLWGLLHCSGTCKMKSACWNFHECSLQRVCRLTQESTNGRIFPFCIHLLGPVTKALTCISCHMTPDRPQSELMIGCMWSLPQARWVPQCDFLQLCRLMSFKLFQ